MLADLEVALAFLAGINLAAGGYLTRPLLESRGGRDLAGPRPPHLIPAGFTQAAHAVLDADALLNMMFGPLDQRKALSCP